MSFLNPVRLAFAGTFQADVSTVNNDVRHYDNAAFQPVFQDLQGPNTLNGWWNPEGSGAFRLIDCRVTGLWYSDGSSASIPSDDDILGTWIGGSARRTSGKIVDIDPQWQLASALWGLQVRLTTADGTDFVSGRYKPHPFRDLWFSRTVGQAQDGAASSTFQSVLEDVRWSAEAASKSRFLSELSAASPDRLSIRLATFSYQGSIRDPRFTLGTVVGAIGPQLAGEPESFLAGRRFNPASGFSSWSGITYFTGLVDAPSRQLFLDLSNALQIVDRPGTPNDIGRLVVGILTNPSTTENTPVTADSFVPIAEVPYRQARWLQATGGVFAAPMTDDQMALAADHPLALVVSTGFNPGGTPLDLGEGVVGIRESDGGQYLCAEPSVHRIDAGASSRFTVYALQYGARMNAAPIQIRQTGRVSGQGGGDPNDANPPAAPIPDIGVPEEALDIRPSSEATTSEGTLEVSVVGRAEGPGNPRGYIDGQVYLIDYRLPGQSDTARQPFDFVIVHARDAVQPVEEPTWNDVAPVLAQYANLYPIMSKRLVNLADEVDVLRHRKILELAFSLDISDPNYMPVTRDLSAAKLRLLLNFLSRPPAADFEAFSLDQQTQEPAEPEAERRPVPLKPKPGDFSPSASSKRDFAAGFRNATKGRAGL